MPEVVTIIVTYNAEKWINNCLDCLLHSTLTVQVVIIDNASTDHTKDIISKRSEDIMMIENEKNLGFGQANNMGLKYAIEHAAEFILLLNQDAYLYPDTVEELVMISEKHPEYGIISPLQLDGSGQHLDQLFRKFITNNYPESFVRDMESRKPDGMDIFPVRFVNAAAWFIPAICLRTTGLFSPLFYHYGEDNNYCSRAQYHGFKAGITPRAAVRHDRTHEDSETALLQRQIQLVPLYILLDIRRSPLIAGLIAFWKFTGYIKKSMGRKSPLLLRLTWQRMAWVVLHYALINKTRKNSKKCYLPGKAKN
jgi:GT2 family glycosyltransferase